MSLSEVDPNADLKTDPTEAIPKGYGSWSSLSRALSATVVEALDASLELDVDQPGARLVIPFGTITVLAMVQVIVDLVVATRRHSTDRSREPSRQLVVATAASGHSYGRLLYVCDSSATFYFLVDTGANVSVIPREADKRNLISTRLTLQASNNTKTRTHGQKMLTLNLDLR
ncbi:unnamed protein product [Dicrocoelium dendriticum]|nr:unnamed protein product [Dicrocoelium dendriticum]